MLHIKSVPAWGRLARVFDALLRRNVYDRVRGKILLIAPLRCLMVRSIHRSTPNGFTYAEEMFFLLRRLVHIINQRGRAQRLGFDCTTRHHIVHIYCKRISCCFLVLPDHQSRTSCVSRNVYRCFLCRSFGISGVFDRVKFLPNIVLELHMCSVVHPDICL